MEVKHEKKEKQTISIMENDVRWI